MRHEILKSVCAAALFVSFASACTVFPSHFEVKRTFGVLVTDRGKPVAGISIVISRFRSEEFNKLSLEEQRSVKPETMTETIATAISGPDGMVHFQLGRTGDFDLSTKQKGESDDWVQLTVSDVAKHTTVNQVPLSWPSRKVVLAGKAAGQLFRGLYENGSEPLKGYKLALHDGVTYEEIETVDTDDNGRFAFTSAAEGLHFIQIVPKIKSDWEIQGDIPIDVKPSVDSKGIELSLAYTSCGLMYDSTRNKNKHGSSALRQESRPSSRPVRM